MLALSLSRTHSLFLAVVLSGPLSGALCWQPGQTCESYSVVVAISTLTSESFGRAAQLAVYHCTDVCVCVRVSK